MWLKVTLLLVYLAVLFILARFLEAVTWYDQGLFSRRLLDPMNLSVLKLKALLDQRGVSYDNVVEKSELTQLMDSTGAVSEDEVSSASLTAEETVVTNYTCGLDFIEQVEDNKDSMWLVEVIVDSGRSSLLSETSWTSFRRKVGMFGVRFGKFDCDLDKRMCIRKGWYSSRLVLALPENHQSKSNVALYSYPGSAVKITSLFDWMKSKLDSQIEAIIDYETFHSQWHTFDSNLNPEVRVVFTSSLSTVPLFLSALSVKFPGRVKIGSINGNSEGGKDIIKRGHISHIPSYLVITPERRYYYGQHKGETFSFKSMELFLKTLHPNLNDIFIVSVIFTNALSCFEISLTTGKFMKRFMKVLWCVFKYNIVLMLLWIGLLALFQLPWMETVTLWFLKFLRCVTTLDTFSMIRKDILLFSSNFLALVVLLIGLLCLTFYLRRQYGQDFEEVDDSDWMNFSNIRTLQYTQWMNMYVSPFDRIFNPGMFRYPSPSLQDLEQPNISSEYIRTLPIWPYRETKSTQSASLKASKSSDKTSVTKMVENQTGAVADCYTKKVSPAEHTVRGMMDGNCECQCDNECHCVQRDCSDGPAERRQANPQLVEDPSNPKEPATNLTSDDKNFATSSPVSSKTCKMPRNSQPCKPRGFMEDTQCVICLDSYLPLVMLRGLPCGHVFHDKCILKWLLRDNHFCPVCRWPSYKPKTLTTTSNLHAE